jgi:DNA polymerase III delta prime subunit
MNNDFLWVEKYRPKTIEECILPTDIKTIFLKFVEEKSFPNLLLNGTAGTGKTTVARALLEELDYEYMFLNASKDRNIDTVRNCITNFCSTMSFEGKKKAVILDEADGFTAIALDSLRGVIEEFKNCRFIFTCNFKNKIIPAIHSRTSVIDFTFNASEKPILMAKFLKRISHICKEENIEVDLKAAGSIVKKFFPDNRRILNELQKYAINGKISAEIIETDNENRINEVVKFIKEKDLAAINQWIVRNSDISVSHFYRELYDILYMSVKPESIPKMILAIADYDYKNSFVSNPDINTTALLVTLMGSIEFK